MIRHLSLFAAALVCGSVVAESVPLPRSMAALGDSMTAGALAGYRRSEAIYPWVQASILGRGFHYLFSRNVGAVEQRHLSWSTGLDRYERVVSHARRLADRNGGVPPVLYNFALSGAASDNQDPSEYHKSLLKVQLPNLLEWSKRTLKQGAPDYVTLMIGPNDICSKDAASMTPVLEYYRNVSQVVDTVLEANPDTRLLISAIPNIESLRRVAKDARLMPPIARTCKDIWRVITLCPTLMTLEDPEERRIVARRVMEYNEVLEDLKNTRAQVHGDRIRFDKTLYDFQFTPDHLSVDCFHPNPEGQQAISDHTWAASWWADDDKAPGVRAKGRSLASKRDEKRRARLRERAEDRKEKCTREALERGFGLEGC